MNKVSVSGLYVILIGLFLVASCRKDSLQGSMGKLKTITEYAYGHKTVYEYIYDVEGRRVKELIEGGAIDYVYKSDSIFIVTNYTDGNIDDDTTIAILNSQGLVYKTVRNAQVLSHFEYDSEGQLIKKYNASDTLVNEWMDGNITSARRVQSGAEYIEVATYYDGHNNSLSNTNNGISFYGKSNKEPLKSVSSTHILSGSVSIYQQDVQFDDEGRTTKIIVSDDVSVLYTYY